MNIHVVTQYFWPEEFRINDLVHGLIARGHHVTIQTGLPNYPKGEFFPGYGLRGPYTEEFDGQKVLRSPLVPRGRGDRLRLASNYASFVVGGSLNALFRTPSDVDVIFVYGPSPVTVVIPAAVAKWRSGAPIFFWVLDLWPESLAASGMVRSKHAAKIAEWAARFAYRASDVLLGSSHGFARSIRRVAKKPVEVRYFPQWADEDLEPATRSELPSLPDGFRVMFTGNVGNSQDFETILAAAERLCDRTDIHWVIAGDGMRLPWVRKEVERRGLERTVHLLGRLPSSMMPPLLAEADILLATLRSHDTFAVTIPSKIQSYLAAGKPLVTAIDGEVTRIVQEAGVGVAVPAGDASAIAEAVQFICAMSPHERQTLGENGRSYFTAHFSRDKLIDQLETWFEETISARKCSLGE